MKIEEIYITLREKFAEVQNGEQINVSLYDLADDLFYSLRNMRIVIKKMNSFGWITWIPGRGRGNNSSIIFHLSVEEVQLELFKAMIFDGKENEAFIRVESEAPSIKMELTNWYYKSKFIVYYDPTLNRQFVRIRELITKENVDIYCKAIKETLEKTSPGFTILIDMMSEITNTPDVEDEMEELRQLASDKGVKAIALYTSSSYLIPYLKLRLDEMGSNLIFPSREAAENFLDSQ
ncbi:hypothetical protein GCM10008967_27150 [Bacillus carboniphilus]|uniref:Transcriptional regulator SgrR N-terminal HTH domain-containing protein n=2 Tax=Bacillus carboniphilus TaxID=86663 RepID=A0ABN0WEN4_9BACI